MVEQYVHLAFEDPKKDLLHLKIRDFEKVFDTCIRKLGWLSCDHADLRPFANAGGKLIIDHGLDDPLIPVEGTIDYYHHMREIHGGQNFIDRFCRLYINPGDGHGNCHTNGPGMTESTGIQALMNWVEHNKAPENLPAVLVNQKTGKTIRKGIVNPGGFECN